MRFTIMWQHQGRTCRAHTDSQIDAMLAGAAISWLFDEAVVLQGTAQVGEFHKGVAA